MTLFFCVNIRENMQKPQVIITYQNPTFYRRKLVCTKITEMCKFIQSKSYVCCTSNFTIDSSHQIKHFSYHFSRFEQGEKTGC